LVGNQVKTKAAKEPVKLDYFAIESEILASIVRKRRDEELRPFREAVVQYFIDQIQYKYSQSLIDPRFNLEGTKAVIQFQKEISGKITGTEEFWLEFALDSFVISSHSRF
jgi:hypothetical protein